MMRAVRLGLTAGAATAFAALFLTSGCVHDDAAAQRAQGWTQADRDGWYYATQGSRLIPYAWFQALEQAESTAPFADEQHLLSYGYIPAGPDRPNRLPVGFAIDRQPDEPLRITRLRWYAGQRGSTARNAEPWLGFNCAACHTAELRHQGQAIRVDGGPGLGDFDAFIEAVDRALVTTRQDQQKWDRFAAKVLSGKDNAANRTALRSAVDALIDWQQRAHALNQTPLRAGFARVDAFGHIYNKVVLFAGAPDPIVNPADAPVSYPFLWNINKQKKVQWNGAAENARLGNFDYGAMGRNAGEVLGVYGELTPVAAGSPGQPLAGYRSSVYASNLESLERLVAKLQPPPWPASFPPIDQAKVAQGRDLFRQNCASCHKTPDRQVAGQPTEVMVPFHSAKPANRTDIWMACNALTYQSKTGLLRGTKDGFINGEPLPAVAPVVTMLATSVKGALVGKKGQIVGTAVGGFLGIGRPPEVFQGDVVPQTPAEIREAKRAFCTSTDHKLLAYKARPLDGIWATAPYLHNGSVPTLYHLLLPAAQRPREFHLGTRDYDPRFVGYDWRPTAPGNRFRFEAFEGGRPKDGNANVGHDYGAAAMSEADRWALVEYMKTL
jgi:mono/diheme cytochrome c family protein